jgi:7-carboxy-7-deazaguanine synthase (Cx14CxxC type)
VKEIFYTLQGEGANAGRAAVFVRFAGCNLWSGRELDRLAAACRFCDTDFVGGDKHSDATELAKAIEAKWPGHPLCLPRPLVVLTGGEPALQVDQALIAALRSRGFEIAIETNGTRPIPPGIHWVTVSPKAGAELVVTSGDELKLVFPQLGAEPRKYEGLDFGRFYLQAMDGPDRAFHERSVARYCLENPKWRASVQLHKYLGLA